MAVSPSEVGKFSLGQAPSKRHGPRFAACGFTPLLPSSYTHCYDPFLQLVSFPYPRSFDPHLSTDFVVLCGTLPAMFNRYVGIIRLFWFLVP